MRFPRQFLLAAKLPHRRFQLPRMGEVGHERQGPARRPDLLEQPEGVGRVRVADEPLWPVGQGLGADADRFEVLQ